MIDLFIISDARAALERPGSLIFYLVSQALGTRSGGSNTPVTDS